MFNIFKKKEARPEVTVEKKIYEQLNDINYMVHCLCNNKYINVNGYWDGHNNYYIDLNVKGYGKVRLHSRRGNPFSREDVYEELTVYEDDRKVFNIYAGKYYVYIKDTKLNASELYDTLKLIDSNLSPIYEEHKTKLDEEDNERKNYTSNFKELYKKGE